MVKNNKKSQKGITMISLIIYVSSFLTVTLVIGYITTFFYNNTNVINNNAGMSADYNLVVAFAKRDAKAATTSNFNSTYLPRYVWNSTAKMLYYKESASRVITLATNVSNFTMALTGNKVAIHMTINNLDYYNVFVLGS